MPLRSSGRPPRRCRRRGRTPCRGGRRRWRRAGRGPSRRPTREARRGRTERSRWLTKSRMISIVSSASSRRNAFLDGVGPADRGHRRQVVQRRVRRRSGRVGERSPAGERPQRVQRPLPGVEVAGVARHDQVHRRAVRLGRDERQRRRVADEGDRRQLVGRRRDDLGVGPQPLAGGRVDDGAAEDGVDRVEPVAEAGRDPEVAAAAAERPEEVGVLRFGRRQQPAVGGDDVDRQQVVDRHPVLAHQPAHPAAERQPGDADGRHVAARRRQPVDRGCERCTRPRSGRLPPRRRAARGSTSSRFMRERSRTSPSSTVPYPAGLCPPPRTASGRSLVRAKSTAAITSATLAGPDDQRRVAVDGRVPDPARPVVLVVAGPDDVTAQPSEARRSKRYHGLTPLRDRGHRRPYGQRGASTSQDPGRFSTQRREL